MNNNKDLEDKSLSATSPNDLINKIITETWLVFKENNPILYEELKQTRNRSKNIAVVDENNSKYIPSIRDDRLLIPIIIEDKKTKRRESRVEYISAMSKKHRQISRKLKSLQKHQIYLIFTFNWVVISYMSLYYFMQGPNLFFFRII